MSGVGEVESCTRGKLSTWPGRETMEIQVGEGEGIHLDGGAAVAQTRLKLKTTHRDKLSLVSVYITSSLPPADQLQSHMTS